MASLKQDPACLTIMHASAYSVSNNQCKEAGTFKRAQAFVQDDFHHFATVILLESLLLEDLIAR
jgi:hypothetical protein